MENVITLGKFIGLLFCSLPPLYFVFENSKNTRNELARPVMGTIFLVYNVLIISFTSIVVVCKKKKKKEHIFHTRLSIMSGS